MYNFAETYPKFKALEKLVHEFQRYIENNLRFWTRFGIDIRVVPVAREVDGLPGSELDTEQPQVACSAHPHLCLWFSHPRADHAIVVLTRG